MILEAIGHKSGVTMIGFDGEKMDRNVLLKGNGHEHCSYKPSTLGNACKFGVIGLSAWQAWIWSAGWPKPSGGVAEV